MQMKRIERKALYCGVYSDNRVRICIGDCFLHAYMHGTPIIYADLGKYVKRQSLPLNEEIFFSRCDNRPRHQDKNQECQARV